MSRSIFGVRIYTQTSISHDEIGLFNGVFCLSDGQVTSSGPWKYGMVPDNSLGDTDDSADVRDGGNISQSGGFDVVFANAKEKASQILEDEGITLINKRADLIEIDSGSGLEYVRAIAVCSEISWHETDMILSFVDASDFSDANISKAITDEDYPGVDSDFVGNWIPSTFGIIDKAKLVSVSTGETAKTNGELSIEGMHHPTGESVFFVFLPTVDSPTLKYRICFGSVDLSLPNWFDKSKFVGKYLKPIAGKSVNEYREIVNAVAAADYNLGGMPGGVEVEIKSFFSETLLGDRLGENSEQTWVSIVDITKELVVDVSSIEGFLDSSGTITTTNPNLFAFSDESKSSDSDTNLPVVSKKFDYRPLPNYLAEDTTALHNSLYFKLKEFKTDPNTMESNIIVTPIDMYPITDKLVDVKLTNKEHISNGNTLVNWGLDAAQKNVLTGYKWVQDGLYILQGNSFGGAYTFDATTNPPANALDKNVATHAECGLTTAYDATGVNIRFVMGYKISPPRIEENFDFDSVYLLINGRLGRYNTFITSTPVPQYENRELWIRYNRWAGFAKPIVSDTIGKNLNKDPTYNYFKDMLDDYYGGYDKNQYYYKPATQDSNGKYTEVSGYTNFVFDGIKTIEQFNSISELCVLAKFWLTKPHIDLKSSLRIYEVAISFLKSISIKDNIYCPVHGRVYGGTWGGRKTATAVITNPVDLLEYLDRRKNTAYYLPRRIDWGLEPTPDPLVNTSSDEGGYDWAYLSSPKAQTIAFQAFTEDTCSIKALQKKICAEFFLVKYRDGRGRECVNYIGDGIGVANIDKNITLADIPPEAKLGEVEECPHEDVVSSRITLRYKKNYGNDQYSSAITISNIYQPLYRSEYVTGYDGCLKEALWIRAHYLWSLYGDSTNAKEKIIDLETIRNEDTAVWHLQRFLTYQGRRRRNVVVKYDTARKWNLFDHVAATLPDLNNGNVVEAIIEKKQAVRSRGVTNLGLVLISGIGMQYATAV